MARIRTIKPQFFLNEELVKLSAHHRLLFIGLWTQADREGRLEDRPLRIKAELFPYEDLNVDQMLTDLAAATLIIRYAHKEKRYIQVVTFSQHQFPHYKEVPSTIPAPKGHRDSPYIAEPVSASLRQQVMERGKHRCANCQSAERLTVDHVVPRSKGGTSELSNLQILCGRCNTSKNNREASSIQHQTDVASTSTTGREGKGREGNKSPADAGSSSAKPVENPALTAEFKKIEADGLNLYALLGRLRKTLKWPSTKPFPEEVLLAVCASYWRQKPVVREAWPWFLKVLQRETRLWSAEQNVKEANVFRQKGPLSLGDILARAQAAAEQKTPGTAHASA